VSQVEQIEKQIERLSREDLADFRAWFLEFDASVWDQQIDADSQAGSWDSLISEALADYGAGKAREI
jgi:hypothetical protein